MALPQLQAMTVNNPNKGGFWSSTPASALQLPTRTGAQQQFSEGLLPQAGNILQMLQQRLSGQQGPQQLSQTSQDAMRRFRSESIPLLAERFGALGGESRGSSGLFGQLAGAEAGLQQGLQAQEEQQGMQQNQQLMGLLQLLTGHALSPQFENIYDPGSNAGWQNALAALLGGLGQGIGKAGGAYMTGGLS